MTETDVIDWLLAGDPAIRWQTLRDLVQPSNGSAHVERERVVKEGWGRALLDRQLPQGSWAEYDPGWMITMDALTLLREFGAPPSSAEVRTAVSRVKSHLFWERLDNRPYFDGDTEACINGAILAFGSYFGERCVPHAQFDHVDRSVTLRRSPSHP